MTGYEHRSKLKRFLAKLLVCVLVVSNIALAPATGAMAETKKPKLSSTSKDLLVGEELQLTVKNKNKNATCKWKSSDKKVATVNQNGLVKGMAKGKATITCTVKTATRTYKLTCKVTVRIPAKSITISNKITELKVGETYNLNRKLTPKSSNDKTTWKSSNTDIATVASNGMVTALKKGTVTITAKTLSGKKDTVKIKVVPATVDKTITSKDIENGVVKLSDATYDNLTVDKSVGNAAIILEHVKVKDTLYMTDDAAYSVMANDSEINNVVVLESESKIVSMSTENQNTYGPTFVAGKGTLVVNIDARGNVSVKQEGKSKIGTVTVSRSIDGNMSLNLEGFEGNLIVNTLSNASINISTRNCAIETTTIGGTNSGQKIILTDDTTGGAKSNIGKINVETSAKLSIDVPAKEVVITNRATNALVTLEKPVENVVNEGTSTTLNINNNIGSVKSAGDKLTMKVAAGSTVRDVELSGKSSSVEVALGSKIETVVLKGESHTVSGSGEVVSATVEGNNANIATANTKVTVGENATGTKVNGSQIPSGSTIAPTPSTGGTTGGSSGGNTGGGTGGSTGGNTGGSTGGNTGGNTGGSTGGNTGGNTGGSTGGNTGGNTGGSTGGNAGGNTGGGTGGTTPTSPDVKKITISNPGDVYCGTSVIMNADVDDVVWSVYDYIDDSNGYATINSNTGELTAVQAGTVRVVAVSKADSSVYGAVDLVIQGKKFVRMLPLNDVYLDSDDGLIGIPELAASGRLPEKVTLIYETGEGNKTEEVTVSLYQEGWFGDYYGNQQGNYLIQNYVSVPEGYERPKNLYADVVVHVMEPQTDNRLHVVGIEELSPVTLTTDEHIVNVSSLISEYFYDKPVTLKLSNGQTITEKIDGYFVDSANRFNGAVPGEYKLGLIVQLPAGIVYREIGHLSEAEIYWNDQYTVEFTVPVNVVAAQTPLSDIGGENGIPATTQPKFTPSKAAAAIESVVLNMPSAVNYGDILDLNQYVVINTSSTLESDRRVTWTIDGYSDWNGISTVGGRWVVNKSGTHKIRAISAIDSSKYDEVTVTVSGAAITGFVPFNTINVTEDRGIISFVSLYNALKVELPTTVTANIATGSSINMAINGWFVESSDTDCYVLRPYFVTSFDYNYFDVPLLKVILAAPQSDNRIVLTEIQPLQQSITIDTDQNATKEGYLTYALYHDSGSSLVPVQARLQNGETITIKCALSSYNVQCSDPNLLYRGEKGDYVLTLTLTLPDGYKYLDSNIVRINIPLKITVDQTPRYDNIWVSQYPDKMTYTAGEKFDFTGIIIMLQDYSSIEDYTFKYISSDNLSDYNLLFYIEDNQYNKVDITTSVLTEDMNGKYIYVQDLDDYYLTYFGPVTVNSQK